MNTSVILDPQPLCNFPGSGYLRLALFHCQRYLLPQKPCAITAIIPPGYQQNQVNLTEQEQKNYKQHSPQNRKIFVEGRRKLHVVDVDVTDEMNGVGPVLLKGNALSCSLGLVINERE